jgi:glutamate-1-semialdehyde aminotransferase
VISYLREHPEIYDQVNATGDRIRQSLRQIVDEEAYPVDIVGDASLFMVRFVPHRVRSVRDLAGENKVAGRTLYPLLASYGLFIPHAHFALVSAAHTDEDVEVIVDAYRQALLDLRAADLI